MYLLWQISEILALMEFDRALNLSLSRFRN